MFSAVYTNTPSPCLPLPLCTAGPPPLRVTGIITAADIWQGSQQTAGVWLFWLHRENSFFSCDYRSVVLFLCRFRAVEWIAAQGKCDGDAEYAYLI